VDEYRRQKCDKGYVEWWRDNRQKIEDGMGFKGGVLGLRTYMEFFLEETDFIQEFKDFIEGK